MGISALTAIAAGWSENKTRTTGTGPLGMSEGTFQISTKVSKGGAENPPG